jgi:hypothetical protein
MTERYYDLAMKAGRDGPVDFYLCIELCYWQIDEYPAGGANT